MEGESMNNDWTKQKQHHGVSEEYIKKTRRKRVLKEWLISLLVTVIALGCVVGAQYWFTGTTGITLDPKMVWLGNAIGGVIMLLIVHHFVKAPKDQYHT